MKNYLIVGHSSGIGKALSSKLAENNNIIGTYYKSEASPAKNVSSYYLNVLDEHLDLSFLPEKLHGLVY